ncbi:MAG: orotate phosphoribosyltransferase [Elusimicrobia bacterium]|nr:orotate phosphoribosyltransferase [Elusimicrobiota bacterium]
MAEEILKIFVESGALLEGHFLLSSGLHSDRYVQCALVLQDPAAATALGAAVANLVSESVEVVVSPALGGVIIGQEVARALKVKALFTERENGIMSLRRGFHIKEGQRVLVVEDVLTTGKSTREVMEVVLGWGGRVVAMASLISRAEPSLDLGIPRYHLLHLPLSQSPSEKCGLCRAGVPLVKPGSRPLTLTLSPEGRGKR